MPIERRMSRDAFIPTELVQLKQICLTPNQIYQPGKYLASELPDIAFTMGLVARTSASPGPDQPPAS